MWINKTVVRTLTTKRKIPNTIHNQKWKRKIHCPNERCRIKVGFSAVLFVRLFVNSSFSLKWAFHSFPSNDAEVNQYSVTNHWISIGNLKRITELNMSVLRNPLNERNMDTIYVDQNPTTERWHEARGTSAYVQTQSHRSMYLMQSDWQWFADRSVHPFNMIFVFSHVFWSSTDFFVALNVHWQNCSWATKLTPQSGVPYVNLVCPAKDCYLFLTFKFIPKLNWNGTMAETSIDAVSLLEIHSLTRCARTFS